MPGKVCSSASRFRGCFGYMRGNIGSREDYFEFIVDSLWVDEGPRSKTLISKSISVIF